MTPITYPDFAARFDSYVNCSISLVLTHYHFILVCVTYVEDVVTIAWITLKRVITKFS